MLRKGLAYNPKEVPPKKRLRMRLAENFLAGKATGLETAHLLEDAVAAGAANCKGVGGQPSSHSNRNLRRKLLKDSGWPKPYWAKVRVWHNPEQRRKEDWLPLLLPHEIVHFMFFKGDPAKLLTQGHLPKADAAHIEKHSANLGCTPKEILALGLWSDGVPCNYDRSQSFEVLTLSLPGLPPEMRTLRIPLFGIKKHHSIKQETMDDVMSVICWSLEALATGTFPNQRHDGAPWQKGEHFNRQRKAGKSIGCKALLTQIRGDWKMLKDIFRLPQHNEKEGCCWKCPCKPENVKEVSSLASWRVPFTQWDLLVRMRQQGVETSPLFACPCFNLDLILLDWLHIVDLGVAADFLGNLFWMVQSKLEGSSKAARVQQLFLLMQDFYQYNGTEDRLNTLTVTMLRKKPSAPPKLKAGAAECRPSGLCKGMVFVGTPYLWLLFFLHQWGALLGGALLPRRGPPAAAWGISLCSEAGILGA